jgi:hypothetical protein
LTISVAKYATVKMPFCLVLGIVVAAAAARADDTGLSGVVPYVVLGAAGGIIDIAATVYDIKHLASGEPPPKDYGIVETVVALPQMGIAAGFFISPPPADGVRTLSAMWFVWATALAAHGIWTIARPDNSFSQSPPAAPPFDEARTTTAPLLWSVRGRF